MGISKQQETARLVLETGELSVRLPTVWIGIEMADWFVGAVLKAYKESAAKSSRDRNWTIRRKRHSLHTTSHRQFFAILNMYFNEDVGMTQSMIR